MAINDPRDISGLVVWYSPEYEAANYSDGAEVTTLTDLSGNANHATGATTSTAKPLWKATGGPSGGAERLRFENGGYFTLPSGVMAAAAAGEIMSMIKSDYSSSSAQGFWHFGSATTSNHWPFTTSLLYDDFGISVRRSLSTAVLPVNVWRRVTMWSASADWACYIDGTLQHSAAPGDAVGWATVPTIGNSGAPPSNTSTNTFEGDHGAIVLYNRKLTTTERDDLVTWMAANPSGGVVASATIAVGQTSETDTANSISHASSYPLGQASETDIAFPMSEAYVGNAVVEIAFNSGYSTPAASRTWTDVSDYLEAHEFIEITYGRQDEFSTCDANTCRLTLDNSDGRFTARRASSPYYPNVKIGRPLRVTTTRPGGSASTRFVGYIDDWPLEWDGASNYAKTQITATSRMARLGGDRQLKSIVEEEILEDGPAAYYTLGEPEGATTAADSSGNSAASLTMVGSGTAVVFGTATGPGTDGLTAASFASGKYLSMELASAAGALECFFITSSANVSFLGDVTTVDATAAKLGISSDGKIMANTTVVGTSPVVNDGATHHVLWSSAAVYVDGVNVGSPVVGPTSVRLGVGSAGFTGTIAHVAAYTSAPSATRATAHADAGLTGFEGDTPGERIERYATQAAVPLAEIDADAGTSPMAHVDTTGQSAMDMLRVVETTENGVLHDARDNTLRFHDRTSRYLATSAFTLSMSAQQVENGFVPKVDRTGLLNDVTATLSDGTVTARAVDQDSVDDYGRKSVEIELATTDVNEPHAAAWSRVNTYSEPRTRIPAVSVDILPLTGTLQDSVLDADVGTRFAVTGIPSQAETTTGDFFVEGYTEAIGHASHVFTFNVSDAAAILDSAFVLDSATRGVLDTNRLAY